MIDGNRVNKIIQDELENSRDPGVVKTLMKLQHRISDLEENELNYMYEEWSAHERQRKHDAQRQAEVLIKEYFG